MCVGIYAGDWTEEGFGTDHGALTASMIQPFRVTLNQLLHCSTPAPLLRNQYSRDSLVGAALLRFFSAGIAASSSCLSCTPGTYSGSAGALNREIYCVF
jgi:hypothetical protein